MPGNAQGTDATYVLPAQVPFENDLRVQKLGVIFVQSHLRSFGRDFGHLQYRCSVLNTRVVTDARQLRC